MNAKTKALKEKVVDKVGSILSTPSRAYHGSRANRFNREAGIVKKARQYDGMPSWDGDKPTDAFKYRSASDSIKNKYKEGVK